MMMQQTPQPEMSSILEYRLDKLQESMTAMNAAVAAQNAQLMTLQLSLPDKFLTRLEFAEILRQKEQQQGAIEDHLVSIDRKDEAQDKALLDLQNAWQGRMLGVIGTAFLAFISLVVGGFGFVTSILSRGHTTP